MVPCKRFLRCLFLVYSIFSSFSPNFFLGIGSSSQLRLPSALCNRVPPDLFPFSRRRHPNVPIFLFWPSTSPTGVDPPPPTFLVCTRFFFHLCFPTFPSQLILVINSPPLCKNSSITLRLILSLFLFVCLFPLLSKVTPI